MSRFTQKKRFWTTHIEQWQSSGLSQTQYCKNNDLKARDFYRWKNRITAQSKKTDELATKRGQFLPLTIQETAEQPVTIKSVGVTIKLDSDSEPLLTPV